MIYGSGGTARWSKEVLRQLQSNQQCEVRAIAPRYSFFGKGISAYLWEQFLLPIKLRKGEILFSPSNLGSIFCKNQALVIHDLLPLQSKQDFSRIYGVALRTIYRILIGRVNFLFTVSEQVRNQIVQAYPEANGKILVVGGGITPTPVALDMQFSKDANFCLVVGAHIRRKNLKFLLQIWDEVFRVTGCKLVATSRFSQDRTLATKGYSGSQNLIWFSNVLDPTDDELAGYYLNAKFTLQPSIGEGFGLPLLESMNLGTPFVSNEVGISRDICVGASRVFPLNSRTWISYLTSALISPKNLNEIEIQRLEARKHTWEQVARRIIDALE